MPFRTGLIVAALVLAAGSAAAQGQSPELSFDLHLRCLGATSVAGVGRVTADDPLQVDIEGDQGRIRIPHVMRHPGGDPGWRSMSDLLVDQHLVTGHFAMSLWNRPKVVIDRVSGRLDLVGFHGFIFHGDCAAYDADTAQKF
jgi:hypothetical protein